MSKKEIEIKVVDTDEGVALLVGKRTIGFVTGEAGAFEAMTGDETRIGAFKTYADAEEAVVSRYNLAL